MNFPVSTALSIGSIISKIVEQTHVKPNYLALFTCWAEIVGVRLAEICTPHKVLSQGNHKILVIKTKKCCSLEVQHESDKILHAINDFLKQETFSNIVIFQMDINEQLR